MKKVGFTLAELLVAMAIIGIVSAIVIPTFIANSTGKKYQISFKKGINSLSRAATANYGLAGYDFSTSNGYYGEINTPSAMYSTPGGATDGAIIGFNTQSTFGNNTHSDLHRDASSLFHIWHDNLNLKATYEVNNYAVLPADVSLNCASRSTTESVQLKVAGEPNIKSATLKSDFVARQYSSKSVIQGSGNLAPLCNGRTISQGGINQGRMFMLEDGMVFTYDPAQAYCLESNPCYGYIDVNGPAGPNRVVSCTEGEDSFITTYGKNAQPGMLHGDCTVKTRDITDIYPVLFYNQIVKPASWAAKSVFFNARSNQVSNAETALTSDE